MSYKMIKKYITIFKVFHLKHIKEFYIAKKNEVDVNYEIINYDESLIELL